MNLQGKEGQQPLWTDDIYQAIETDCKAITVADGRDVKAWAKVVGHLLWPEKSPDTAGKFLNNCLDSTHAQKIDITQVLLVIRKAHSIGSYMTMFHIADDTNFTRPEPTTPEDEQAKLMREFNANALGLKKIAERIEEINKRTRI